MIGVKKDFRQLHSEKELAKIVEEWAIQENSALKDLEK